MRVVFLDIDGVLNCQDTFMDIYYEWKKTGVRRTAIDEKKVALLKEIVDIMDAEVVLSSCWRLHFDKDLNPLYKDAKDLVNLMDEYKMSIYSKTGKCTSFRGHEIKEWLGKHPEVDDFIILDDDVDMGEYQDRLIRTDFYKDGLSQKHVDMVREKYNLKHKSKNKEE